MRSPFTIHLFAFLFLLHTQQMVDKLLCSSSCKSSMGKLPLICFQKQLVLPVLDVILEKPMAEALKVVHVAGEISNALIYRIGVLAPVYDFMLQYETANWAEVSRLMLLKNIDMNTVYEAYTSALKWYRTVR